MTEQQQEGIAATRKRIAEIDEQIDRLKSERALLEETIEVAERQQ